MAGKKRRRVTGVPFVDIPVPIRAKQVHKADDGEVVRHVSEAACSVELSRDAKGVARWSIKLYGDMPDMNAVLDEVLALDKRLREETRGG